MASSYIRSLEFRFWQGGLVDPLANALEKESALGVFSRYDTFALAAAAFAFSTSALACAAFAVALRLSSAF